MPRRGEVGCSALNDHGNYNIDHGKIMEKSWNFVFEFLWEPCHKGQKKIMQKNDGYHVFHRYRSPAIDQVVGLPSTLLGSRRKIHSAFIVELRCKDHYIILSFSISCQFFFLKMLYTYYIYCMYSNALQNTSTTISNTMNPDQTASLILVHLFAIQST